MGMEFCINARPSSDPLGDVEEGGEMGDDLVRVQKDEWATVVRILHRIEDFADGKLKVDPDDTECAGQIQKWCWIGLRAAWKGAHVSQLPKTGQDSKSD